MRVIVGVGHARFAAKAGVIDALRAWGHDVVDVGTHSEDPVDFPDVAVRVTDPIRKGEADRGVLVCGTGIGASMAANKIRGIRAALAHDAHSAHQSVEHDDASVLCLGAQVVGPKVMVDLLQAFTDARWLSDEEFQRSKRRTSSGAVTAAVVGASPEQESSTINLTATGTAIGSAVRVVRYPESDQSERKDSGLGRPPECR